MIQERPYWMVGDVINFKECKENYGKIILINEYGYYLEDYTFIHYNNAHLWELKKQLICDQ